MKKIAVMIYPDFSNYNIEVYAPPVEKPEDTYSEIWLPVERIG